MLSPDMTSASVQLVSGSAASCHPVWTVTRVIHLLFMEGLRALTCGLTGEQRNINAENNCNLHFSPNRVTIWQ